MSQDSQTGDLQCKCHVITGPQPVFGVFAPGFSRLRDLSHHRNNTEGRNIGRSPIVAVYCGSCGSCGSVCNGSIILGEI